jgi:hypothetical protein
MSITTTSVAMIGWRRRECLPGGMTAGQAADTKTK